MDAAQVPEYLVRSNLAGGNFAEGPSPGIQLAMTPNPPSVSDQAVQKATGRTWKEWEDFLDKLEAAALSHKEIVALVGTRGEVKSGWWQQTVAVEYEKLKGLRVTGETEGTGFQVGAQRTLDVAPDEAWKLLTSPEGLRAWLGSGAVLKLDKGEDYRLRDGAEGEVRVVRPGKHLRITWKPKGWARPSTIQARVEARGGKTVIGFHQEHLPGVDEREERRAHFRAALDALEKLAGR